MFRFAQISEVSMSGLDLFLRGSALAAKINLRNLYWVYWKITAVPFNRIWCVYDVFSFFQNNSFSSVS